MLKAQTALATDHFSDELGVWGYCNPSSGTSNDVQYKSGTLVFSTNEDVQYKPGNHQVLGKRGTTKSYFEGIIILTNVSLKCYYYSMADFKN